ncbi:integrase [Tissierella creatinini]|nr:integrase [Tissierella creatinini]TJX60401.1 integrase [Soehngenia saccharolytica]
MKKEKSVMEVIHQVKELMKKAGYLEGTINKYNNCWMAYLEFTNPNDIFSSSKALDFLEEKYGITVFTDLSKSDATRARAIQFLCQYNQYGRFSMIKISTGKVPGYKFKDYLDKFKVHQKNKHLITDTTLKHYDDELGRFLLFLDQNSFNSLNELDPSSILNYCGYFSSYSSAVRHNAFSTLRVFLRYLFNEKLVDDDFSELVPTVSHRRGCKIPTSYTNEEVDILLKSIDRSSPIGKRDYAIILIAIRLGLRSSDIRLMKFSSIHWEKNTIELTMEKTKELIVLPLLKDVGEAIIEYIKYGRPNCEIESIFVTHVAPIKIIGPSGMTAIVRRNANNAGIDCSVYGKGGPHSLRSTLATHLLENNIPLPVISEILGHKNTRTTEVYLKLDIPHLRKCSLEVPLFHWNKNDGEVF